MTKSTDDTRKRELPYQTEDGHTGIEFRFDDPRQDLRLEALNLSATTARVEDMIALEPLLRTSLPPFPRRDESA